MHGTVEQLELLLIMLFHGDDEEAIHAESAFGRIHSYAAHYRYY
jgi:hypothetical protein